MKDGMAAGLLVLWCCRRKCLQSPCCTFHVQLHQLWALLSIFGTIFLHHNSTTINKFYSQLVLLSSVIKSWISGGICAKVLQLWLWVLIAALWDITKGTRAACAGEKSGTWWGWRRSVKPVWWQENRGGVRDDVDEIRRKFSVWRPLQSDRLTTTWGVRVLSPDADKRDASRRWTSEKADECDDNKIQADICLHLLIS